MGYDGFGSAISATDPTGTLTRTSRYDRFGRLIGESWPTAAGTAHTSYGYDLDGNQTVACAQGTTQTVAEACGDHVDATPLPPFVTATTFDAAGRPVEERYDRIQVEPDGTSPPGHNPRPWSPAPPTTRPATPPRPPTQTATPRRTSMTRSVAWWRPTCPAAARGRW